MPVPGSRVGFSQILSSVRLGISLDPYPGAPVSSPRPCLPAGTPRPLMQLGKMYGMGPLSSPLSIGNELGSVDAQTVRLATTRLSNNPFKCV
jgi:hypothetical protein